MVTYLFSKLLLDAFMCQALNVCWEYNVNIYIYITLLWKSQSLVGRQSCQQSTLESQRALKTSKKVLQQFNQETTSCWLEAVKMGWRVEYFYPLMIVSD